MVGVGLAEQGYHQEPIPSHVSVKEAVFPFIKFPGVDPLLGPEMKSTGEVMGVGSTFGEAFAKAQLGAGNAVPKSGTAFISVRKADRSSAVELARDLDELRFVISTDSHHVTEYDNIKWGVRTARRGWVPRHRIINTRPLDDFLAFVAAKRT